MAKTRKTATSGSESAPKKPVRRLKKKAEATAAATTTPMVDTNLAAQAAARMLAAKAKLGGAAEATAGNRETSTFKQLKESLNKPASSLASNVLGNAFGPHKSNLPTNMQGQVFHNQTQGGGSRVNVPRRTAG
jgi:hypothetical protein